MGAWCSLVTWFATQRFAEKVKAAPELEENQQSQMTGRSNTEVE